MNKFLSTCAFAALMAASGATVAAASPAAQASRGAAFPAPGMSALSTARPSTGNPSIDAWQGGWNKVGAMRAYADPSASYTDMTDYTIMETEDGRQWIATQHDTFSDSFGSIISSSLVSIYDEKGAKVGDINITLPADCQWNSLILLPQITTKFFDLQESSREVMVQIHGFDADYNQYYRTLVYEIGASEPKVSLDGGVAQFYNHYVNSWTKVQRLAILRETQRPVDEADETQGMQDITQIEVYANPSWGQEGPQSVHTFEFPTSLIYYSEFAPYFQIVDAGGQTYYVLSHYAKDYMTPESQADYTQDPIPADDNDFVVEVYSQAFAPVATMMVPVEQKEGYLYTFYGLGAFSYDDVNYGMFVPDQLNFIITTASYDIATDGYKYAFTAYDADGTPVREIGRDVVMWKRLFDIPGRERQYTFLKQNDDDEQYLEMVDFPSANVAATFPATIDDRLISYNFDRYPAPAGDTYYVFSMAQGDVEENGDVTALIGWYNSDATVNHYDRINLGPDCEYYTAFIYGEYLNPYLFNTNERHEYIGVAKQPAASGTGLDNVFMIADDRGDILFEARGDAERGQYYSGGVINYPDQLYIFFYNQDLWTIAIDLYDLPLTRFDAGGTGTLADPYIITTVGDLMLIADNPGACYRLEADLDMSTLPQAWTPISAFAGVLDGGGHTIYNLNIDGTADFQAGLFAYIGGTDEKHAKVYDLNLYDVALNCSGDASEVGIVAGALIFADIDNVHVRYASISGDGDANIGGIVGAASLRSSITSSSVTASDIDMASSSATGGIVGVLRTGSSVASSAFSGSISAASPVGGIVGSNITGDESVTNCHVSADIRGRNSVGGVLGSGRLAITNCVVEGTIAATQKGWDGYAAGGVVGYLDRDWSYASTGLIRGNVVAVSAITTPEEAPEEGVGTVHRIAGNTIANELDEENEGQYLAPESALADNYVVQGSLAAFDPEIGEENAASTEGANVDASALTAEFLQSIGFTLGQSAAEPWMADTAIPHLFFEDMRAPGLSIDPMEITIGPDDLVVITITSVGSSVGSVDVSIPDVVKVFSRTRSADSLILTLAPVENGSADLIATSSDGTQQVACHITVSGIVGIESIAPDAASPLALVYDGRKVTVSGTATDATLALYTLTGTRVATSVGSGSMTVEHVAPGLYLAVATDRAGRSAALKIVVK